MANGSTANTPDQKTPDQIVMPLSPILAKFQAQLVKAIKGNESATHRLVITTKDGRFARAQIVSDEIVDI